MKNGLIVLFSFVCLHSMSYAIDRDSTSIIQMQNQFALKFSNSVIKSEQKENGTENIFISPFSLNMALGLLINATDGSTRAELLRVLNIPEQTALDLLNVANEKLIYSLSSASNDSFILEIANGLWIDFNFPINSEYQTLMEKYYQAKVVALDFQNGASANVINSWVSSKTHQKIKTVIEPKDLRTLVMLLANATYFKGQWLHPFMKQATQTDVDFTLWNGQTAKVNMMQMSEDFHYAENDQLQVIELPYKKSTVSAYVILPKEKSYSAFSQVRNTLFSNSFWQMRDEQRSRRHGYLKLPKFQMEYTKELTQILNGLGMNQVFQDNANMTPLSDVGTKVSFILQKTYVNVDEFGTEAAAVTAIGIRATAINGEHPPFEMVVDHPFYFVIREKGTGTILFVGSIAKP